MARSTRHAVSLALGVFAWALALGAPARAQLRLDEASASGERHPPGTYLGVKPGGNEAPPGAATPNTTPTQITWPGFQMRPDGSSRVFVQTTAPVSASVTQQGKLLLVDLGEAQVSGETNRFALFTRFFNTPVVRVQIKPGKRVVLELELRASVQPAISSERAASGFHFLYIDFPAGSYLGAGSAAVTAPPAAAAAAAAPPAPAHLDEDTTAPPAPPEPSAPKKAKASAKGKASLKL